MNQSVTLSQIEVSSIVPSPFQHRRMFDESALRELSKSIERDGLIQPITVRPIVIYEQLGMQRTSSLIELNRFELIAGERRWRAIKQFTSLQTITARVLDVDDLQARRLCATENLQRADLTSLEEVMALCELVDASLLEFSADYAPLSAIQEPKWRVKALLTKLESDRRHETDYFAHKFMGKVQEIFSGLPKPKDVRSFEGNDLPLLFTANEVQQFALEHRLNKAQTKAIDALQKAAPEVFKDIVKSTPEQAIQKIVELASDPVRPVADNKVSDIESVNDFSAETIRQAAKNHVKIERLQTSMDIESSISKAMEFVDKEHIEVKEVIVKREIVVSEGEWWKLGRHKLYCGDTSKPEFYNKIDGADFAFADPPYGAEVAEWDGAFYWDHDWLIDKAPIVAVTPGIISVFEFARKTAMPYRWSMASWITNGMTRSDIGFGNWIYLALFSKENESIYRQAQDIIRCTIDISTTNESNHRGRKPVEMMVALTDLYCKKEGIIIDPFLGSGTTLFVAEKTNRSCIGGELSSDYCKRIIDRWELTTSNKAERI